MEPVNQEPRTLRTIFDRIADEYDAIRPDYPAALIDDIIAVIPSPEEARILEIGCGTGQATLPFAQRGYEMLCLELGPSMAALAVRKCEPYPNVTIEVTSFEDWPAQPEAFDLVMSATAFHWIPPEIGYPKAAQALKPGGTLAIFANEHPTPYTGFFAEVQPIYDRLAPDWSRTSDTPTLKERIVDLTATIDATELFTPVEVKTYAWSKPHTAQEYIRLLNTYSGYRNLPPELRAQLFRELSDVIESRYGGRIAKPYLTVLHIAQKRA